MPRQVYEEVNCDNLLWVEKLQFPIPGQQLPKQEPYLAVDSNEGGYLFKYGNERLVYGMPTYFMFGLRFV